MFILNLHGIGAPARPLPASEARVWVPQAAFHAILDLVVGRQDIRLTFDDANVSDFTLALPALRTRGLKAQFFLVADRIDQPGYLTREQVTALLDADMNIGSHGLSHCPWARLDPAGLETEVAESRRRLRAMTGREIREAAAPFGSYNRRVLKALHAAGYTALYTSDGGPASPGSFLVPRNTVYAPGDIDAVQRLLTEPSGPRRLWRGLKLAVKRWR